MLVHLFLEGHKTLPNLHRKFDRYYMGQIYSGYFAKTSGHLRVYELYYLVGIDKFKLRNKFV